jgi:2-phospho-L-lactate guanylyltransferase (CobY/MobA/RfbA family)
MVAGWQWSKASVTLQIWHLNYHGIFQVTEQKIREDNEKGNDGHVAAIAEMSVSKTNVVILTADLPLPLPQRQIHVRVNKKASVLKKATVGSWMKLHSVERVLNGRRHSVVRTKNETRLDKYSLYAIGCIQ